MNKHTPGPWFVQPDYLTVYGMDGGNVGTTCAVAKPLREQPGNDAAEANARLIAAAPDLLEAAETVLAAMDAGLIPRDVLNRLIESRIKSAIAKAIA